MDDSSSLYRLLVVLLLVRAAESERVPWGWARLVRLWFRLFSRLRRLPRCAVLLLCLSPVVTSMVSGHRLCRQVTEYSDKSASHISQ